MWRVDSSAQLGKLKAQYGILNQKGQVERLKNTILESGLKIQPTTSTSYPKPNKLEVITKKKKKLQNLSMVPKIT